MTRDYIRTMNVRGELGISAKGLDVALKRKEIEKYYPYEKNIPYLLKSDFEIIKKHIANNGRVKSVMEKDKKEVEIEVQRLILEKENEQIKTELTIIKNNLENAERTNTSLEEINYTYRGQIEALSRQASDYQQRLQESNQLLLLEKAESKKYKELFYEKQLLLESAQGEIESKKELEQELAAMTKDIDKRDSIILDVNNELKGHKEIINNLSKDIASKESTVTLLEQEKQDEIESRKEIQGKLEEYENMSFMRKFKMLFSKR